MKSKIWLSLAHMGGREQEFIQEAFDTNSTERPSTSTLTFTFSR